MKHFLKILWIFCLWPSYGDLPIEKFAHIKVGDTLNLKLRFESRRGNYLAFYNNEGIWVLLAFRKNLWDYSKNFILENLHPGNEYQVEFQFKGFYSEIPEKNESLEKFLLQSPKEEKVEHEIRKKQKYILGEIIKVYFSLLQDLRF